MLDLLIEQQAEHTQNELDNLTKTYSFAIYEQIDFLGGIIGKGFGNTLHIPLLAIDKSHRRKGLGRKLVKKKEKLPLSKTINT